MLLHIDPPPSSASDESSFSSCSERRLAAHRADAQLSTGPRTPEGKAHSSLNAVKTGLAGRTLLFAGEEDAAEYRAHRAGSMRAGARWATASTPSCSRSSTRNGA